MMKWKVMKNCRCNSIEHEDVRKSLEILDNVLAEFDDSAKGPSGQLATNRDKNCQDEQEEANGIENDVIIRRNKNIDLSDDSPSDTFLKKKIENGATSRTEVPVFEEDDKFSPPPVPKRNPATRLSSREDLFTCNSIENIYSNDFEIRRHIFDTKNRYQVNGSSKIKPKIKANLDVASSTDLSNLSSNNALITPPKNTTNSKSIADDNDDVFVSRAKLTLFRSASTSVMNDSTPQRSPSVASRRALYEKPNLSTSENTKRPVIHSDSSDTSFPVRNSPFLRRKFDVPRSPVFHKRNTSDSKSSKSDDSTSEDRFHPTVDTVPVFDDDVVAAAAIKNSPSASKLTKEQERIARLNEKFAEVRYLLKTNQIRPLDSDPPSFVPTPPKKVARKDAEVSHPAADPPKLKNALSSSDILSNRDSGGRLKEPVDVLQYPASFPSNISSISGLLPTDTLNRPHLGLSYSMEDDLSPGVKEILTSTPKSDRSMVGLSTFSQSVSSLGYGSGQSDLDLNVSLKEENKKIPISTLKSQTLPIGMKLGPPFSYVTDINYDCDIAGPEHTKIQAKIPIKCEEENGHHRSSSAPPMKHLQRKNIFGMSKKSPKEDKNKKDDNISMKSDLSLDEGILFRKFVNIDGSTENQDLPGRKQPSTFSEEKTKRRSVWKSILRRK